MLIPQQNDKRDLLDLSGFWDLKLDPNEVGESGGWFNGLYAARTIAGLASWNEQLQNTREIWSEEYQGEFLRSCLDVVAERPYVVGLHVWNFADFKTTQGIIRAGGLNQKGVFTGDRHPILVLLSAQLQKRKTVAQTVIQ